MTLHLPVMTAEVLDFLQPQRGGTFLDCTLGAGGHARALLEAGATRLIGIDRDSGALAITDHVRVGQTVQFHVRDADTADEDLHALLQMDLSAHARQPAAALLFSCNGRGTRMFAQPHHDAGVLQAEAGDIPVAGFFAQGELGPVGGQNFIHGFTASVALFE